MNLKERNYPKFTKAERSSFRYWFWHWRAFNSVAKELGMWKLKYIFHDLEKPFMKLFLPYKTVQKFHRTHNRHHLEYPGEKDWEAMFIDWECSRFTKEACPRDAIEEANYKLNDGSMSYNDYCTFIRLAMPIAKTMSHGKA